MFSPARPRSFVCLSVCLCARLLKNACMDLNEMLRVYRYRDMDELINFEPNPDHSPDVGSGKSESRRSVEVGQTGTSLRAGYRSRDALQRYCLLHVLDQGPGSSKVD